MVSVALTVLFGSWVAWRSHRPEFDFLVGRSLLYPVQEGPEWDNSYNSFPPQRRSEAVYGFKANSNSVIHAADLQLLSTGWSRDAYTDWVSYTEPGGLERTIRIERDMATPTTGTSDLIAMGEFRRGWTGVTITWPNRKLDWKGRIVRWFDRIVLGQP
jgi:hypothetical protein